MAGGAHIGGTVAAGAAAGASQGAAQSGPSNGPTAYDIDTLFRIDPAKPNAGTQDFRGETIRILATGLGGSHVSADDRTYLAQLVAARTGLSQADAEKRVDDVIAKDKAAETKARQVADDARKATSTASLLTFLSMLIGAFIACAAGALGGALRDDY